MLKKLPLLAAAGTMALAVPAIANAEHSRTEPVKSHKREEHKFAYEASGKLVKWDAKKNADGTYSGKIVVHVTKSNRHTRTDTEGNATYTLDHAKVTFGRDVKEPATGQEVKLAGRIRTSSKSSPERKDAGELTIRRVEIKAAHRPEQGKRPLNVPVR